jgi:hypothetical protein
MAKAKRKPKQKKKHAAREAQKGLAEKQRARMTVSDPLGPDNLKKLGLRIGIPTVVAWAIAISIAVANASWIPIAVVGGLTAILAGLLIWAFRFARKSRNVADILRGAETAEQRKEALEKLDEFKDDDTAAIFAKAQLQMQEDPRAALRTLETIKLDKVMAAMADQARSQRAMLHLMLGETDKARTLADNVDLARHKDHQTRATLAAVVGEAWARTGQARKAADLLENFDPSEEDFTDLAPQLYRSLAFAYAWSNQTKKMKQVLRKMKALNVQLLMGFITKKKNPQGVNPRGVHPMLEKEAFSMVMKSGAVQRKMQVKRM